MCVEKKENKKKVRGREVHQVLHPIIISFVPMSITTSLARNILRYYRPIFDYYFLVCDPAVFLPSHSPYAPERWRFVK